MGMKTTSGFRANVARLASGTVLAQAISILVLPLLTRLYSASEFGIFVVFQAAASVLGIVATGRFEFTILSAKDELQARQGLWLVVIIAAFTSIAVLAVGGLILSVMGLDAGALNYSWLMVLLALVVGLNGAYLGLYSWSNRYEEYGRLALNRVIRSVAVAVISVTLGILEFGAVGLVIGTVGGQAVNTAILAAQIAGGNRSAAFPGISPVIDMGRKHSDYPKFLILSGMLERVAGELHVFLLSGFFGPAVAGSIGLYRRVVSVPSRTVGQAIRHVFRQRAAKQLADSGECRRLFSRTTARLAWFAVPVFVFLLVFAPSVFPWVFGEEWDQAGRFAQLLSPMFLIGFITSPLSSVILVGNKPRYDLMLQGMVLILTVIALFLGKSLGGAELAVFLFGMAHCVKSMMEFWVSRHIANGTI
jgi:O-antigen/teichoic acid export membrane protein